MSTFTKEQLIARINQVTAINNYRISRDPDADGLAMDNELFAIALASLEAEAMTQVLSSRAGNDTSTIDKALPEGTMLYTAPPAPVSVPDEIQKLKDGRGFKYVKDGVHYSVNYANGWNQCRAAMLQGKAEPVSNRDEFPLDYLQGLKDGLEWAAQLAEANHPHTGDWLYDDPLELAKAIRKGPDMPTESVQGWIPCSERMPEESGRYWCYVEEQNDLGKSHYQWNCSWNGDRWWVESENGGRVTHWQPLPSPPAK